MQENENSNLKYRINILKYGHQSVNVQLAEFKTTNQYILCSNKMITLLIF